VAALLTPVRREHVSGHAYAIPSPARRITVEVLNATSNPGVARAATRQLRRHGLDVVFFGNANASLDSTQIVVRRGDVEQGRSVRQALGQGRVVVDGDTLRRVDVSVILGRDFRSAGGVHP
jgi:hypothetical protein